LIIQSQWIKEYLSQINAPKIEAIKKVQKVIKNQQKINAPKIEAIKKVQKAIKNQQK